MDILKIARKSQRIATETWPPWAKVWGTIGPALAVVPQAKAIAITWGIVTLAGVGVACIGWGIWRSKKKKELKVKVPGRETTIQVEIGDIFEKQGVKVIPVNEYFDDEVGGAVAKGSIHGQFITRVMPTKREWKAEVIRKGLAGKEPVERRVSRSQGATARDRYAIGTYATTKGRTDDEAFVLVALSRTDPETLMASAEIADLCKSMVSGCEGARERSEGREVSFPLMGGGLSKTGIGAQERLDLLIQVIRLESAKIEIAKSICIVLTKEVWQKVDLNETKRRWSK